MSDIKLMLKSMPLSPKSCCIKTIGPKSSDGQYHQSRLITVSSCSNINISKITFDISIIILKRIKYDQHKKASWKSANFLMDSSPSELVCCLLTYVIWGKYHKSFVFYKSAWPQIKCNHHN